MTRFALPALFTILMWWFSTGAILCAVRRPDHTRGMNVAIATLFLAAGLSGLYIYSDDASLSGVYIGFLSALAVWGWLELTFLLGLITGPHTAPAPVKRHERAPLFDAISTVIYHELAIAVFGLAIYLLTTGGENTTGFMTYMILWALRLSAKINVYLGVPNLTEEFLPANLQYLKTYFCHRPMNMFFPVSITGATLATAWLVAAAGADGISDAEAASFCVLATLMGLALIEHWFLVLPFNSAKLWQWGVEQEAQAGSARTASFVTPSVPPIITPIIPPTIINRGAT